MAKKVTVRYGRLIPFEKLEISSLNSSELRRARDIIMNEIGALIDNE